MLQIKKSRFKNTFIVYDPTDFTRHTHVQREEIAAVVKRNVEQNIIPKTQSIWLLESHIRVSIDPKYIGAIQAKIKCLKNQNRHFGIVDGKEQDKFGGS